MPKPENDGITHVNIYSKGKTELGRFLSNFYPCPIETEDGPFKSIEGYWYWLSCKREELREAYGFTAKNLGRAFGGKDWLDDVEFKAKISQAITLKLSTPLASEIIYRNKKLLDLPLKHYYTYGTKVVEPKEDKWIVAHIKSCLAGTITPDAD